MFGSCARFIITFEISLFINKELSFLLIVFSSQGAYGPVCQRKSERTGTIKTILICKKECLDNSLLSDFKYISLGKFFIIPLGNNFWF